MNNHFFENGDKSKASAVILQSAKNKGIELTISGNELMKKMIELESSKNIDDLANFLRNGVK